MMSKGNKSPNRLTSSYSNLTNMSPTTTPVYTRPHGGYRGILEQYPLSVYGFDKPAEYLENVRNSVMTQYVEEENERSGSPQWVPRYNSEINHTGEQPLIVQQYLSGNKQEQRNGVLPAGHVEVSPRLRAAAHRHREERLDYQHGNSTHQYLTATDMPGQSHQIFDKKLGRPTRTSLLRTRYRSRSAPGVRALLEVHHLHKQQYMAAKTKDKFKSVDIPKDLQPLTDSGETIHQFITGARYNRSVFRDPNYLAAAGVSVSKQGQQTPSHFPNGGSTNNGYLTNSKESIASTSLPNSNHPSHRLKEAWGSDSSLAKSHSASRATSAARTTTPLASTEAFAPATVAGLATATQTQVQPQQRVQHPFTGSKTIIDGSALHNTHQGGGTGGGCQDCVMCRKGVLFKGMPGTFKKKMDPAAKRSTGGSRNREDKVEKYIQSSVARDGKDFDSAGHQLVQQYHLRILGVKIGVEESRSPTPRSVTKLHYDSTKFPQSRPVSSRKQLNKNKNNSGRRSSDDLSIFEVNQENRLNDEDKISTRSSTSMLSIRIDTPNLDNEDAENTQDTPRDENKGSEEQNLKYPKDNHESFEEAEVDKGDDQRVETADQTFLSVGIAQDKVQSDSHGQQTQDKNGNFKNLGEEGTANNEENNDSINRGAECVTNPTNKSQANNGAEQSRDRTIDPRKDISDITKAVDNVEIGKDGNTFEKLPTGDQRDNLTDD